MYGTETDTLNRKNVTKWPALLEIHEYKMEYSNTQTEHSQRRKHPEQVSIMRQSRWLQQTTTYYIIQLTVV